MNAEEIIENLGLVPLENEGGYYREVYRAEESVAGSALDERYSGNRCHCTAIYYLVTPDSFSALHRVKSDEIFHFYAGDPVEMLQLTSDGRHSVTIIGSDLQAGERPLVAVPRGVWQGTRLAEQGKWALLGCTVAPGFEFDDYEHGERKRLIEQFPECGESIIRFTR